MARFGPSDIKIEIDDSEGGTLVDITQHVTDFSGISVQATTEETTPFGSNWQRHDNVKVYFADQITMSGPLEDGANTPNAIFAGKQGETRTLKVSYGTAASDEVEVIITRFARTTQRNQLVRWEVTLQPTGTVTQA